MLNRRIIILFFIHIVFGYSIFDHVRDFKFSSSNFIGSYNLSQNFYNFSNPASNFNNKDYLYSSFGFHFDGVFKTQQLLFSLNTDFIDKLNIAILRSSVDNIYNTTDAWLDCNNDGIVNNNEINYDAISRFNHSTLGLIISKPFTKNNFQLGINSKLGISNIIEEHALSYSFDLGFHQSIRDFNFGILIKDILPYTYWTTGEIDKGKASIILGSNTSIDPINISFDLDPFSLEYFIGLEYDYNSLFSIHLSNSTFEKVYLGFFVNLDQLNIGYSFVIPHHNQLGPSQTIILGLKNLN